MRIVRNIYFWLILGSIAFIAFSAFTSSFHPSQKEIEACEADDSETADMYEHSRSCEPLPPFASGFICCGYRGWRLVCTLCPDAPSGA
jgi:hypothetical protein